MMKRIGVPTASIAQRYSKGSVVEARVLVLKPFEALVRLNDGTEGVIRKRELSWGPEPDHPRSVLSRGQTVKAKVLGMDRNQPRISLSLRQAERDPWNTISERYKIGQVVHRAVTRLWRLGAFVEMEPAVDGFLPLQEVCSPPPAKIEEVIWIGDTIEASVTRLDHKERRIELSIKHHLANLERKREVAFRPRLTDSDDRAITSLGDFLSAQERTALVSLLESSAQRAAADSDVHSALTCCLKTILIADDDPSFRGSLQRLLKRMGHEAEVTDSAEKAVALCQQREYDLVLIDLGFAPGAMDGLDATRQIVAAKNNLPVIILTGASLLDHAGDIKAEATATGARTVLLKPIELSVLYDAMSSIVDGHPIDEAAALGNVSRTGKSSAPPGMERHHEGLTKSIQKEMVDLQEVTRASACILFSMDMATRDVHVFANVGTALKGYDTARYTLQATPVDDVIRLGRALLETDVSVNPQEFQYLDLLDFASCIGVPVRTFGQTEYGMFLFNPRKGHFTRDHLRRASATAKLIGAILAREDAERAIQRAQPFVFFGQIASTTIHELNNRLGSVVNDAETLKMDQEVIEADLSRAIDNRIRSEMAACIRNLAQNSLAMQRITSLGMGIVSKGKRELVNINELIQRVVLLLSPIAEANRVKIRTEMEDDLPPTLVVGVELEQAFVNVVLNAIQHIYLANGEGGLIIHSRFEKQSVRGPIQIRFTDTGPGIHGSYLEKVFDLGFSTRTDGSGLGLFTTRWLLESMSGRISVEKTAMLVGTTFLVEVPLVVPAIEEDLM